MLLRVHFGDNDYSSWVYEACKRFMDEVSCGYTGYEAQKEYDRARDTYGLDVIRTSLITATCGFYLVSKANELSKVSVCDFNNTNKNDFNTGYLNTKLMIEEVVDFRDYDDNHESCYIDFYNGNVYLK